MSDLYISKDNAVNIKIDCERGLAKELSDYFTFKVPGHKYMPAFQKKKWDGQIKLYNIFSQEIYAGLLPYVLKFANDRKYSVDSDDNVFTNQNPVNVEDLRKWIDEGLKIYAGGKKIKIHDQRSPIKKLWIWVI